MPHSLAVQLGPETPPHGPPAAPAEPRRLVAHGDIRPDNYFWLRDRDNPAAIAYLEAENAWTAAAMAHTGTLQEDLYREMLGRIQETDLSVPERTDDWW